VKSLDLTPPERDLLLALIAADKTSRRWTVESQYMERLERIEAKIRGQQPRDRRSSTVRRSPDEV
jgi:hypothetical protein